MSEYRHFISYLYEYQRGRKGRNCGFVKVEIRNGICRLRLHLQPAGKAGDTLQVYGFVRDQSRVYGVLLGSVSARNNLYEFQTSSPASAMGNSRYAVDDLRGVWLRGKEEENYITVWDDEPVSVERFAVQTETASEDSTVQVEAAPEDSIGQAEAIPEKAVERPGTVPEKAIEQSETMLEKVVEQTEVMRGESTEQRGTILEEPDEQPDVMTEQSGVQPEDSSGQGSVRQISCDDAGSLWARWQKFLDHYVRIEPFADEEITQCICIAPKDLSFLQKEEWRFSRNTFVRQGYMRYHHLLLGCHTSGRFVLAVPGTDDAQERHLARMCDFPYYKEAALPNPDYEVHAADETGTARPDGYWYRFLNEICPTG